jgi:hypothetical protein
VSRKRPWYGPYIRVTPEALTQAINRSLSLSCDAESPEEFSIQTITKHNNGHVLVRRLVFRCYRPGEAVEFVRSEWVVRIPSGVVSSRKEDQP